MKKVGVIVTNGKGKKQEKKQYIKGKGERETRMKKDEDKGRQRETKENSREEQQRRNKKHFFPVNIKHESYGKLKTYD